MAVPDARDAWRHNINARPLDDFLADSGEMGRAIRAFGWDSTPLGPISGWSSSLKSSLRLVLSSGQAMCFWWGPELISFHNDAYIPILGERRDRALGRPMTEVWPDVWEGVLPMLQSAISGKATWLEDMPLVMERNGYPELTHWTFSYSPIYGEDGRLEGVLNIVNETTAAVADREALREAYERVQQHLREKDAYEAELRLLNRELAHRMKNMLAMAQSIVNQSLRGAASPGDALATINARIGALSRAQDILTGTGWSAGTVGDIVAGALDPHRDGSERISTEGPDLSISARQGVGLALAIHELATNATKYGSLSVPSGQVAVRWSQDQDGHFSFSWAETGGPAVTAPTRRGFGSTLTERVVSQLFEGEGKIGFEPEGVRFDLRGLLDVSAPGED